VRTIRAELLKLQTAPRTTIGVLLGMLALVALGAVGTVGSAQSDGIDPGEPVLRDLLDIVSFSLIFALIVGLLIVTWEFRHGTIEQTFIVAPRREQVMAAKAVAAALAGALLAVLSLALAVTIAYIWIGGDPAVDFGSGAFWGRASRVIIASALWGPLGVGVGALVRNQAAAIVLVFVWLFVLEPLVPLVSDTIADYTLGGVREDFLDVAEDNELGIATAGLLTAVYAGVLAGIGTLVTLRRDIT
jgi:ABC-2 type transport system permease protein